jgi:hypothetical protein
MKWLDLTGNLFPEVPILQNADISEKDHILRFYFSFMKSWTSGTLNLDSDIAGRTPSRSAIAAALLMRHSAPDR